MKRIAVVFFIAVLGLALAAPAFALENQFGGYWRTRMYSDTNFDGVDNDVSRANEVQQADTRTRLYYTAIINDNLKLVNKFEMDAVWGVGGVSYGDIGADGIAVEVKNSYIDFNLAGAKFIMGVQPGVIQRGFIFDDDFSGAAVVAGGFTGVYCKNVENDDGSGDDQTTYHAKYKIGLDGLSITPTVTYGDLPMGDYVILLGVDVDGSAGGLSYWGTFIYEDGDLESASEEALEALLGVPVDVDSADVSAWLIAGGASLALNDALDIHGEAFYATGNDLDDYIDGNDVNIDAFTAGAGQSYYWAEIMGYGLIDNQWSNGSCGNAISNIIAANLGVGYKVSDKLSLGADLWYAKLAEDDVNDEDYLGTEVDLSATYIIVDGLKLDVVAAYLFAGDATTGNSDDDADPIELGAQFSVSF